MADFYTSQWGNNYSPRIRLSVSVSNLNGSTARVSWVLDYVTSGYAAYTNGIARKWTIAIDGQVRSGTYNINGVSSTTRISSGTIDVARGTSARNIAVSASFNFDVSWNGSYSGSRTASGSVGIERKVSYTVSFNANGGSGAPGSQTRWYGEVITLSSTKPTRTGYIFQGWAKSASGSVAYYPGSQYGLDANTTLYAIWKAETYTVSFNANGGSGAPGSQTKTYGQTLTLSSTVPTRTNYNFLGWGTSAGSTTVSYKAGGSYTTNAAVTLYAVWELAYIAPRISGNFIDRCNSAGTLIEEGTYIRVRFNWNTDYNVSAIYIRYKVSTNSSWSTVTVSASGRYGSVDQVIGSGSISTEYIYNVQIEVRDSVGSSSLGQDVSAMFFSIDVKNGGKGVAIGKPATEDNLFDINLPTKFNKGIAYILIPNGSDLNNYTTPGFYYSHSNTDTSGIKNMAANEAFALEVSKHAGVRQTFKSLRTDDPRTFERNYVGGTWGKWDEIVKDSQFNWWFNRSMKSGFSTYLNNTEATFKGEIGLPYGIKCRAYKIGRMITLNIARQMKEFHITAENKVVSEILPSWAKPMSETTFTINRNAGTSIYSPVILHLRSDGSISCTSSAEGTFIFTGTVTYMCSNAD